MNNRIIKAYIEMKKSQNQNTPLVKKTNPKQVSRKHCKPNPHNANTILSK